MSTTPLESTARLTAWFEDYATSHQTRGNQLCHSIGIPMIVFAIIGLLGRVLVPGSDPLVEVSPFLRMDFGILIGFVATLVYLTLDWRLGLPFAFVLLGFYWLGRSASVQLLWAAFVVGWAVQFVGHYRYEKRSPAFLTNLVHLLIGPLWIFAKCVGYFVSDRATKP